MNTTGEKYEQPLFFIATIIVNLAVPPQVVISGRSVFVRQTIGEFFANILKTCRFCQFWRDFQDKTSQLHFKFEQKKYKRILLCAIFVRILSVEFHCEQKTDRINVILSGKKVQNGRNGKKGKVGLGESQRHAGINLGK